MKNSKEIIQKFWEKEWGETGKVKCDDAGFLTYKGKVIAKYNWEQNTATLFNLREKISNDPTAQKWIKEDFENSKAVMGESNDFQHDALNQ